MQASRLTGRAEDSPVPYGRAPICADCMKLLRARVRLVRGGPAGSRPRAGRLRPLPRRSSRVRQPVKQPPAELAGAAALHAARRPPGQRDRSVDRRPTRSTSRRPQTISSAGQAGCPTTRTPSWPTSGTSGAPNFLDNLLDRGHRRAVRERRRWASTSSSTSRSAPRVKVVDYVPAIGREDEGRDLQDRRDAQASRTSTSGSTRSSTSRRSGRSRASSGALRREGLQRRDGHDVERPSCRAARSSCSLTFTIDEGPEFKIREVVFDGNKAFSDGKLAAR